MKLTSYKSFWVALLVVMTITFTLLGWGGREVYREAPPIPNQFVTTTGQVIYTKDQIFAGQTAWQKMGGMSVGTVWGHGAYQAPDWTADWLHRELVASMDAKAQAQFGKVYADLNAEQQAAIKAQTKAEFRANTYNKDTDTVTLSADRVASIESVANYYEELFGDSEKYKERREHYAMMDNSVPTAQARHDLTAFFFWSAWAASTDRPGTDVTYTNNWPPEPLIDNVPTAENIMWSIGSVVLLLAGLGILIWIWAFSRKDEEHVQVPNVDPLTLVSLTPSQKALWKYLLTVVLLFVVQTLLGGLTVHYTVEGSGFFGIPIQNIIPYSLVRTWHVQSAIFWIATAFLSGGLFLVPIINGGKDPAFQRLGVNVLFVALLIVVVGSFAGQFLAIHGIMPDSLNFWLGHQGYEFVELGRLWQIALYIGLVFWLVLMFRGVQAALAKPGEKSLLILLTLSIIAIGLFYGSGFFYGEHTNLSIMEYWRWWIVHLWVEGFFEVFATVAIGFIFVQLGMVSLRSATVAGLMAAILFLVGGVPGTFHHLYFAGTTTPIMAIGAMFSALEVVPLVILGYEAAENYGLLKRATWMHNLKWPVFCFLAVAFWNMLGAGVFGFLINPPVSLFYVQGLNTSANHGHAALFGVYGFLSLGFVLMVLRYIRPSMKFDDKLMSWSFWALNIGLVLMLFMSLLPQGIIQALASIQHGLWYARSEEMIYSPLLVDLRWARIVGDVIFILGAVGVCWQVIKGLLHRER